MKISPPGFQGSGAHQMRSGGRDYTLDGDCQGMLRISIRRVSPQHPCQRFRSIKSGYLFATSSGTPLGQRNVLRALHAIGKKIDLHSFRRFRTETLRRARVPKDLTTLWLGHSKKTVTDFYASGLQKDNAWRREWCDRVGLDFSLVRLLGLQNAAN